MIRFRNDRSLAILLVLRSVQFWNHFRILSHRQLNQTAIGPVFPDMILQIHHHTTENFSMVVHVVLSDFDGKDDPLGDF
jgi:hypothetical protein